jgi:hypothetical protein
MEIISKSYSWTVPKKYMPVKHYKEIIKDYEREFAKDGIKRSDYEQIDFDSDNQSIYMSISGVTSPDAWKVFEEHYGYSMSEAQDDEGNGYSEVELNKTSINDEEIPF